MDRQYLDFISGTISGCLFHNDSIENRSNGRLALSGNMFENRGAEIDLSRVLLTDFCAMYELNVTDVINILRSKGVVAEADMSIGEIAEENNISPVDLSNTVSSHLKEIGGNCFFGILDLYQFNQSLFSINCRSN